MESWRRIWRDGCCPELSQRQLETLLFALKSDDGRLIQRATTSPPPLQCVQDWPVDAACLLGYCGWKGSEDVGDTVCEVEEYFAKLCFQIDQRMGEPAACRWLLNWFDDTPRDEMRREMIAEVELELQKRDA